MVKKVRKIFGSLSEKTLSLHPLRQRNSSENETKQVLKNFEKSSEIFWRFKKRTYLCGRFEIEKNDSKKKQKGSEKSRKNLQKRFGGSEKSLYLCSRFEIEKRFEEEAKRF